MEVVELKSQSNKPFLNLGPGQIVRKAMSSMGWTQEDLADILEMSPKSISQIINNKQGITVDTAVLLSKAFGPSPEFWMNLEQNYRLRLKGTDSRELETETKAQIRKYMPLPDMKKKGWIDYSRSAASQEQAFRDFWVKEVPDYSMYSEKAVPFYARRSKDDEEYIRYYTQTWLRKAQIEAEKIQVGKFVRDKLQSLTRKIPAFTIDSDGVSQLISGLNAAGVKFLVISNLEKTYLDGASFWSGRNPTIVYTGRYRHKNSFWWTIAHEIAHVLLHLKSDTDCFVDSLEEADEDQREKDADGFCRELFNVEALIRSAEPYRAYFTRERLLEVSKKHHLEPSMVLGILQYEGLVTYRTPLNRLKTSIFDLIPEGFIKG
jgi:HTH-type transcriptional regulator/antitoxin HigA